MSAPVIALDGPAGSGKSTIANSLACALDFNLLISGCLYRILGKAIQDESLADDDEAGMMNLATKMDVRFMPQPEGPRVISNNRDVTATISQQSYADIASYIGSLPAARKALMAIQRKYRQFPGLIADGRDMGSVVFPDAEIKIYLTASIKARAQRRYEQLNNLGINASLSNLIKEITQRDEQDSKRAIAPLEEMPDAVRVDTTDLTVDQTVTLLTELTRESGIST